MLCEEIDAEGNEEMKSAREDMYIIIAKAVTRKDGTYQKTGICLSQIATLHSALMRQTIYLTELRTSR